jgi:hypothetical protein
LTSYGGIERQIARVLEGLPVVRTLAKGLYHRLNYLYFSERGFDFALHPSVTLWCPPALTASADKTLESFVGYYDKSPWSPDMTKVLFHRTRADKQVDLVIYDWQTGSARVAATSAAWNAQQGSMTQWLPGSGGEHLIFNDIADAHLVSRIVSVSSGESQTIPWPVQVVHPSGKEALSLNYRRLDALRPEYGYHTAVKNFKSNQSLAEDGIWFVNLMTGQTELRISLEQLSHTDVRKEMAGAWHKVNHFYYSPQGTRFVFMHRWSGTSGRFSRLYVANADGGNLKILLDDRMVSHYSWLDEAQIIVWARTIQSGDHYYLVNVNTGETTLLGEGVLDIYGDGHPTFSPNRRWVVTDSYPNRARQRHLLLFDTYTQSLTVLGRFFAPWHYDGINRCDLHPRWSPDGRFISVDSAHDGVRRSYFLDLQRLLDLSTL